MASDTGFDVPEFTRIGAMMSDLIQVDPAPQGFAAPRPAPASRPAPSARRATRLAATALGTFADAVNWANAAGYRSPLAATAGPRLGALAFATFAAGVNWANSPDAPRLVVASADRPVEQPPPTVDSFLDEFQWD